MKDAAQNVIAAIEGLAREIARRCHEQAPPPRVEFWTAAVELHAKAVLADYLLGDFKPVKPDELQPHAYVPSATHMGDCHLCGHTQHSPIHGRISE